MSVYIPVELQREIRTHFSDRCAYCQTAETLTVAIFEIEHIIPRSAQGQTVFENLCLACPTCNRYKANRQEVLDPVSNEMIPLFHPHLQSWADHFAWDETATEIVSLSPIGRATIYALKMNRPQMIRVRRMWVKMSQHPPL